MPHLVYVLTVPISLRFVAGPVDRARARGWRVTVITAPGPELEAFGREHDTDTFALDMHRRIEPAQDLRAVLCLAERLHRLRPDIVVGMTPKGGLLAMLAGALAAVPARVYYIAGLPFETATGVRRHLLRATERAACAAATRVLSVSAGVADIAVAEGFVPRDKIDVVLHGSTHGVDAAGRFDPSRFSAAERAAARATLGLPADAPAIAFIGRLVTDKGIRELAEAWVALRDRFSDARLVLVGTWEEGDAVPAHVRAGLEQDPRVVHVPFTEEVERLYAAVDLVVLPTYREGLPNVSLEAQAMALPLVATQIPGCQEATEDGVTATLVPTRDAVALTKAIAAYLDDPARARRHGQAGRARVLERFRPQAIWEATVDALEAELPMSELFGYAAVLVLAIGALVIAARLVRPDERPILVASMAAHLLSALAGVWSVYSYYGYGDLASYMRFGIRIAELLHFDFGQIAPEVLGILLQSGGELPMILPGSETTRTMYALAGFMVYLFGASPWVISLLTAIPSFLGKVALYLAFRDVLPRAYHQRAAVAVFLFPSVVFWSAPFLKESVAFWGFGWMVYGLQQLIYRRRIGFGVLLIVAGAMPAALVKPYILMATAAAGGAWAYFKSRSDRDELPLAGPIFRLLFFIGLGFGVLFALGEVFPRFALDNLQGEAERLQDVATRVSGGSGYVLRGGPLLSLPIALFTALYRPTIFEARNPLLLINALETSVLLGFSVYVVVKRGVTGCLRAVLRSPLLVFCLVFALMFGTAVGMTSLNLGTLSRYRSPLLPFLAVLLAVLVPFRQARPAPRTAPRRGAPTRRRSLRGRNAP